MSTNGSGTVHALLWESSEACASSTASGGAAVTYIAWSAADQRFYRVYQAG